MTMSITMMTRRRRRARLQTTACCYILSAVLLLADSSMLHSSASAFVPLLSTTSNISSRPTQPRTRSVLSSSRSNKDQQQQMTPPVQCKDKRTAAAQSPRNANKKPREKTKDSSSIAELKLAMADPTKTTKRNIHQFTKKRMMPRLETCLNVWERQAEICSNEDNDDELCEVDDLFVRPYAPSSTFSSGSNTITRASEARAQSIPVIYTNELKTLVNWLNGNLPPSDTGPTVLGFDVESLIKPHFYTHSSFDGPATIQLATTNSCLVLQLVDSIDASENTGPSQSCTAVIQTLLADPSIIKAGVGIDRDIVELFHYWNIPMDQAKAHSRLDLSSFVHLPRWYEQQQQGSNPKIGLENLSRSVVGVHLRKKKHITLSNWSAVPLTQHQLYYAARDAWAGAAACHQLMSHDHLDVLSDLISTKAPVQPKYEALMEHFKQTEQPITALYEKYQRRMKAKAEANKLRP